MELSKETQDRIARVMNNWSQIRAECFKSKNTDDSYYGDPTTDSPIGELHWDNPNLVWVFFTNNLEGYEGSQTQIGLNADGKLMWEYQSHCSCNGYELSHGHGKDFLEEASKPKSYELEGIPLDWESQIRANCDKLLAAIKKPARRRK